MIYKSDDGLVYKLNKENLTASIINCDQNLFCLCIKRSVEYQSEEYIITSIGPRSFAYHPSIEHITFMSNSELEIIEEEAFTHSSLFTIQFPNSLKIISSKSFYLCENLFMVQFLEDSKLTKIGNDAFMCCGLELFKVPPLVTEIGSDSFNSCTKLFDFIIPENSKLRKIGREALAWTPILSIYLPDDLQEFGGEWCCSTTQIEKVEISNENKNLKKYKESMILGKSDPNVDSYDKLILVTRQVEHLFIPSFIKIIGTSAISGCVNLIDVKFEKNSNLNLIEKGAFSHSSFNEIIIPSSVVRIEENSFSRCENLQILLFENDSNLQYIGKHAFSFTSILKFNFPKNVECFDKEWCFFLSFICDINVSPLNKFLCYYDSKLVLSKSDPKLDDFDSILFARRDIEEITIPSFIKYIKSSAFFDCSHLKDVKFNDDSQLELIESYAFGGSALKKFFVPKKVKKIEKNTFFNCDFLESIEFYEDCELVKIGKHSLNTKSLSKITIPANVEIFKGGFNSSSRGLKHISISPKNKNFKIFNDNMIISKSDPKIDCFDNLLFVNDDFYKITIPSCIKYIDDFTFKFNDGLKIVDFEDNSNLVSIGFSSFSYTSISSITFPNTLKKIERRAFDCCIFLVSVEFLGDDISIDSGSFMRCDMIKVISFPNAHVINIAFDAFYRQYFSLYTLPGASLVEFPSTVD